MTGRKGNEMTTLQTFSNNTGQFQTFRVTGREYKQWLQSWWKTSLCPAFLPCCGPLGESGAQETVRKGYATVYRFAQHLRKLVGDEDAEVMSVPCDERDGAFWGTVHYAYSPAGPDTGYPGRDAARDLDEPGTLAIYRVSSKRA